MNVSPAKENILKRVRNALSQPVPLPFPQAEGNQSVFHPQQESLEIVFAEAFSRLKGRFVFCMDHRELAENLNVLAEKEKLSNIYCRDLPLLHALEPFPITALNTSSLLEEADAGLTTCEALVARTGTVVLSAAQSSGRAVGIFPPIHLVIGYVDQLVFDIKEALRVIKEKYENELPSMISFQTGPSRTSDIEKTSVIGVHGPKEVYVFLVEAPRP